MSSFSAQSISCPICHERFETNTADTINVSRSPQARQQILSGTFHRTSCPRCGASLELDCTFTFADMLRHQFVHVFPVDQVADWPRLEEMAGETFWHAFEPGPPAIEALARRFVVRAVFGLAELAEKLRLWDAQLDDAVVELLKLELVAQEALSAPDLRLIVISVGKDQLELASASSSQPPQHYDMSLDRYRELAASRDSLEPIYPGLFFKPFVSYRRLARERIRSA